MKRNTRTLVLYIMMEKRMRLHLVKFAEKEIDSSQSAIYRNYNLLRKALHSYNINGHILKGYTVERNNSIPRYELIPDQEEIIYPLPKHELKGDQKDDFEIYTIIIFRLIEEGVHLDRKTIMKIFGIELSDVNKIIADIKGALSETKTIYDFNTLKYNYKERCYKLINE